MGLEFVVRVHKTSHTNRHYEHKNKCIARKAVVLHTSYTAARNVGTSKIKLYRCEVPAPNSMVENGFHSLITLLSVVENKPSTLFFMRCGNYPTNM